MGPLLSILFHPIQTTSDQVWETDTRRRTWRTQTWFRKYVVGYGSIRPNRWSLLVFGAIRICSCVLFIYSGLSI
uniref:Uncharacterized protein n=1 Tax=Brassica oleracea TaxID=3712 RepID=A0A3P6FPW8_BRAOL|nr:unnamed protein product [Brassica oleracea]